jgi:hypothetical protein
VEFLRERRPAWFIRCFFGHERLPVCSIEFSLGIWTRLWSVPGAILATPSPVPMTAIAAQFQSTGWLAILLSQDGVPDAVDPQSPVA